MEIIEKGFSLELQNLTKHDCLLLRSAIELATRYLKAL